MKKLSAILFTLAAFMLLATAPVSAFNEAYHVKQAPNNKGDLLFFPFYAALDSGYSTKLTVVNTDNEYSTVAKVVVKSRDWSEELIDFLIYLSPNDMWTGEIYWNPNPPAGRSPVAVYSDDDSVITTSAAPFEVVAGDFASPSNPFDFRMFKTTCDGDTERIGYIEVIASRAGDCDDDALLCKNIDGVVPKTNIYKWYHGKDAINPFSVVPNAALQGPKNILAGWMEVAKPATGMSAAMKAQTFADWYNVYPLTTQELSGIQFDSLNSIAELEAAMAKSSIAMPYVNYPGTKTYHFFNFPTKMSLEDGTCDNYVGWSESPYFYDETRSERLYSNLYNMKEETVSGPTGDPISGGDEEDPRTINREVEYINTDALDIPFVEGWVRYNFGRTGDWKEGRTEEAIILEETFDDIAYLGTPVLPAILTFNNGGMSLMQAAHDDGSVKIDGLVQPYYQYSETTYVILD